MVAGRPRETGPRCIVQPGGCRCCLVGDRQGLGWLKRRVHGAVGRRGWSPASTRIDRPSCGDTPVVMAESRTNRIQRAWGSGPVGIGTSRLCPRLDRGPEGEAGGSLWLPWATPCVGVLGPSPESGREQGHNIGVLRGPPGRYSVMGIPTPRSRRAGSGSIYRSAFRRRHIQRRNLASACLSG